MAAPISTNELIVPESAGDPAAIGNAGIFYTKDDGGVTQAFYRASDGTVTQLTPVQVMTDGDFVGKSWFFSQGT